MIFHFMHTFIGSGMSKWNKAKGCMEEWAQEVFAKPEECGVEAAMHKLFTEHKLIKVYFYDGYWNQEILVPKASSEMRGMQIICRI